MIGGVQCRLPSRLDPHTPEPIARMEYSGKVYWVRSSYRHSFQVCSAVAFSTHTIICTQTMKNWSPALWSSVTPAACLPNLICSATSVREKEEEFEYLAQSNPGRPGRMKLLVSSISEQPSFCCSSHRWRVFSSSRDRRRPWKAKKKFQYN